MARNKQIQIYRRVGGAAGGLPDGALFEGELGYNDNGHSLDIGGAAGATVHRLVGANRQVELAGSQTITGTKTVDITHLRIPDTTADPGDFLTLTDETTGELAWAALPAGGLLSVSVNPPITGTGVNAGTALSITVASGADITANNNVNMVTPAVMRLVTGDITTLSAGITNTSLTAAINSVYSQVTALSAAMVWVGTFDGTTLTAVAPATTGPLPAPAADNRGWTVMVTANIATGTPPVPPGPIAQGDWLISPGSGTTWTHIPLFHAVEVAGNIGFTPITGPPAITSTNVQAAIAELNTRSGTALTYIDGTSITGVTGTVGAGLSAANALTVGTIDGGTF